MSEVHQANTSRFSDRNLSILYLSSVGSPAPILTVLPRSSGSIDIEIMSSSDPGGGDSGSLGPEQLCDC